MQSMLLKKEFFSTKCKKEEEVKQERKMPAQRPRNDPPCSTNCLKGLRWKICRKITPPDHFCALHTQAGVIWPVPSSRHHLSLNFCFNYNCAHQEPAVGLLQLVGKVLGVDQGDLDPHPLKHHLGRPDRKVAGASTNIDGGLRHAFYPFLEIESVSISQLQFSKKWQFCAKTLCETFINEINLTRIGTSTLIWFWISLSLFFSLLFVLSLFQVLTALSLFLLPTDNDSTLEWKSNSYLTQSRRNYWNVFNGWWLTRICCNSFRTIILCALVTEIWWQEPVSILLTLGWID